MHNRQGLSFRLLWEALSDYDMWPLYLLGLTWNLPHVPITSYLTLTLRQLGWNTFEVNLLTIPAYFLFLFQMILFVWVSEKINNRLFMVLCCQIYMLPLVIALRVLPESASPWAKYVLSIMFVGYPYIHPILVALTSRNAGSVRTRTVGSALYNMCIQAASIIGSNVSKSYLVESAVANISRSTVKTISHITAVATATSSASSRGTLSLFLWLRLITCGVITHAIRRGTTSLKSRRMSI